MDWAALLAKFRDVRALVVGDICLDRWCQYDPAEADLSHETGIPRLAVTESTETPGAGGTVANNFASLGARKVSVLGAIGQDGFGFELERALTRRGIDYSQIVASPRMRTFTYTKLINKETGVEDRPRVDFINTKPLLGEVEDQLIANFHAVYGDYDVIVVSDQAETELGGVITPAFREVIADVADRDKLVVVDSRRRIGLFRNALAKPNVREAEQACESLFGKSDLERLRQTIGNRPMVVTNGDRGAVLVAKDTLKRIPAVRLGEPVDTCGAGDAFAAALALALGAGADYETAVRFANLVAGMTVMKAGTGTAAPAEVLAAADSLAKNEP